MPVPKETDMDIFNESSSSSWWESILESGGELIGGAVDLVGDIAPDLITNKLNEDAQQSNSANPSAHRGDGNDYQQPNGDVVYRQSPNNYGMYLAIGGGFLVLAGAVYFAVKGK
ncbi:hypothetical protein QWY97_10505 [Vibrio cortegadensis]|uniref:hypothetical protein n=2 Tax=Vibrio cortegadensis TaxID=1328770 RepID=UPI0025B6161E|nr:hypothetical protein [Vibrio cortegadensis]MDN3697776.1 hypothetical protein [Vibrio cortegadensis]